MLSRTAIGVLVACIAVCGCASTPDVTLIHYLPSSEVEIKVDRLLTCTDESRIIEVSDVSHSTKYMADYNLPKPLSLSSIDGTFADADLKFEFYDDGRLKGINATTTGKGEAIFKSVMPLISMAAFDASEDPNKPACDEIKKLAGQADVLTISYRKKLTIAHNATTWIEPVLSSSVAAGKLKQHIGEVCTVVTKRGVLKAPTMATGQPGMALDLVQPGIAVVTVMTGSEPNCDRSVLWNGDFLAPQFGAPYQIMIPKAAVFGKQEFEIAVGESGTLTSVKYGKTNGVSEALVVVNSAAAELQKTDAERTQEANNESDRIKALTRLAKCKADPASC